MMFLTNIYYVWDNNTHAIMSSTVMQVNHVAALEKLKKNKQSYCMLYPCIPRLADKL